MIDVGSNPSSRAFDMMFLKWNEVIRKSAGACLSLRPETIAMESHSH